MVAEASNEVGHVRVLIGYESVMGNTRQVAEAVAEGLRQAVPGARVQCLQVGWLPADPPDVDLLVLGGPTHFLGLPADRTRRLWVGGVVEASRRGRPQGHQLLEPGAVGPGLREWLAELPELRMPDDADVLDAGHGPQPALRPLAAAFDTRLSRPFAGGAARSIARGLRRHGYRLVAPPEGFVVTDMAGPLREGEVERARRWGAGLAGAAVPAVPH